MLMSGRIIPTVFGKGRRFGPAPTPWSFNCLGTVRAPWVCHFTCWLRIKVLVLPSWSNLILVCWCCALGVCRSWGVSWEVVPCHFPFCYSNIFGVRCSWHCFRSSTISDLMSFIFHSWLIYSFFFFFSPSFNQSGCWDPSHHICVLVWKKVESGKGMVCLIDCSYPSLRL